MSCFPKLLWSDAIACQKSVDRLGRTVAGFLVITEQDPPAGSPQDQGGAKPSRARANDYDIKIFRLLHSGRTSKLQRSTQHIIRASSPVGQALASNRGS